MPALSAASLRVAGRRACARAAGAHLPLATRHRLPLTAAATATWPTDSFLQVEEQQQAQEEKKGKGKASGKRFEIKKWNAVAM